MNKTLTSKISGLDYIFVFKNEFTTKFNLGLDIRIEPPKPDHSHHSVSRFHE